MFELTTHGSLDAPAAWARLSDGRPAGALPVSDLEGPANRARPAQKLELGLLLEDEWNEHLRGGLVGRIYAMGNVVVRFFSSTDAE